MVVARAPETGPAIRAAAAGRRSGPPRRAARGERRRRSPRLRPDPRPGDDEGLDWVWPAKGKLVAAVLRDRDLKGIDIAGARGDPVLASAPGRVVYAGTGLRGYGKLVIVKHNTTYLTAYAHNREILVKEGQNVTRGQKIAEMGSTDADRSEAALRDPAARPADGSASLPAAGVSARLRPGDAERGNVDVRHRPRAAGRRRRGRRAARRRSTRSPFRCRSTSRRPGSPPTSSRTSRSST